jgi:hypothetical protein
MSDVKTSAETAATALSGTEIIRGVQGGANVRMTSGAIAALGAGFAVVAVTYAATTTVDLSPYAGIPKVILNLTLTGNVTFNLTNGEDGQVIEVRVRQDATGSRIWTSGANLRLSADITSIVLSTAASKLDYIGLQWNGTNSKADVLALNKGF